jgi:methylmalonyl-CoA mutase
LRRIGTPRWEGLRDRATALAGTGPAPTVVVAALGERRDFGARETFMANLLAAGGIASATVEGTPADVAAEARSRHTDVVVLASSPMGYSAHAADAVKGLRDNGIEDPRRRARQRARRDRRRRRGADGMDVVAFLDDLLTRLGAPAEGAHS